MVKNSPRCDKLSRIFHETSSLESHLSIRSSCSNSRCRIQHPPEQKRSPHRPPVYPRHQTLSLRLCCQYKSLNSAGLRYSPFFCWFGGLMRRSGKLKVLSKRSRGDNRGTTGTIRPKESPVSSAWWISGPDHQGKREAKIYFCSFLNQHLIPYIWSFTSSSFKHQSQNTWIQKGTLSKLIRENQITSGHSFKFFTFTSPFPTSSPKSTKAISDVMANQRHSIADVMRNKGNAECHRRTWFSKFCLLISEKQCRKCSGVLLTWEMLQTFVLRKLQWKTKISLAQTLWEWVLCQSLFLCVWKEQKTIPFADLLISFNRFIDHRLDTVLTPIQNKKLNK